MCVQGQADIREALTGLCWNYGIDIQAKEAISFKEALIHPFEYRPANPEHIGKCCQSITKCQKNLKKQQQVAFSSKDFP